MRSSQLIALAAAVSPAVLAFDFPPQKLTKLFGTVADNFLNEAINVAIGSFLANRADTTADPNTPKIVGIHIEAGPSDPKDPKSAVVESYYFNVTGPEFNQMMCSSKNNAETGLPLPYTYGLPLTCDTQQPYAMILFNPKPLRGEVDGRQPKGTTRHLEFVLGKSCADTYAGIVDNVWADNSIHCEGDAPPFKCDMIPGKSIPLPSLPESTFSQINQGALLNCPTDFEADLSGDS